MVLRPREEMATGELAMTFTLREKLLAGSILLGPLAAAIMPAAAQEKTVPDSLRTMLAGSLSTATVLSSKLFRMRFRR
jgi:hypothetical protein